MFKLCSPALPRYISYFIVVVLGVLSPILNPVSAAKEFDLSDNSSIQTSNINVNTGFVNRIPTLHDFTRAVQNGASDDLVGVYVPEILALQIIQQPVGNYGYVSSEQGTATLFGLAENYGVIGLLAHNYLAGRDFNKLFPTMEVILIYGNGRMNYFSITEIKYYRALEPNNPYSKFEDLENLGVLISAEELFNQIYKSNDRVVFQTCVSANGEPSWGRLFVTAKQVNRLYLASTNSSYNKGGIQIRAH